MNWTNIWIRINVYGSLAIIWSVLALIVQWCINQWLQYFSQPEITFWQALAALVLFCLTGWLIKYVKNL